MDLSQKIVWNLYSTGVAAIAGIVTKQLVDRAWMFVTGDDDPPEPNDPETPVGAAVARVVVVALGMGLSQVLINRVAAKGWSSFTGQASPARQVNLKF
ncbi:DUF4235 domain-containing protein [Propioniciclava soli]|uniref:DUF4235 domain-containing protein n=1 Tax=Propioniciclava soli TaxID=2775081 RepID=A0ABZ3CCL2_9ACTN